MNRIVITLFFALASCIASAQELYTTGSTANGDTWDVDTLVNTDTASFALPVTSVNALVDRFITWQVSLENVADTATVTVVVEQSLDNTNWVPTDTLVNGQQSIGNNTIAYFGSQFVNGRYVRVRAFSSGTNSSVRTRVWALNRFRNY